MREEFMMDLNDDQLIAVVGGKQGKKKGHKASGSKGGSYLAYGNSSVSQIAAATTGAGSTGNATAGNTSGIEQKFDNSTLIEAFTPLAN